MNNNRKIYNILTRVSYALKEFSRNDPDIGLLSGYSATALFFAYYYRLTGKRKHFDELNFIMKRISMALSEKHFIHSHCSGIAGIMWCIQHLANNGFIEQDEEKNIFGEESDNLFVIMMNELKRGQYDFLHQGLGIALYFLEQSPSLKVKEYLEAVVIQLEKLSDHHPEGICWKEQSPGKPNLDNESPVYNLGLSHGIPAILSVLSMIYEKGIAMDKSRSMVEKGMNWLLSNKNEPDDNCVSLFPSTVTANKLTVGMKKSRLGWCYGDLGIAVTLWNIGSRFNNDHYKQEAYTTFEYILKHRNSENGNINDASLCHGSMGISHIYRRAFNATNETIFLTGSEYWLQQTLMMSNRKDGAAGFKYLTQKGYVDNYNMLEGITGIGLGLIAALDKETVPAWDRSLLIS